MEEYYEVEVPYSGYVRGDIIYKVKATSKLEAVILVKEHKGEEVTRNIIRDDTSEELDYAECYGKFLDNNTKLKEVIEFLKDLKTKGYLDMDMYLEDLPKAIKILEELKEK